MFYLEKFHMNNDVDGERAFSPGGKFNYTVSDLEGYLIRKYEKVIDGQPVFRTEACYEKGSFADSNMAMFLDSYQALQAGGVPMSKLVANQYLQQKNQEALTDSVRGLANSQRVLVQKVDALIDNIAKKLPLAERKERRAEVDPGLASRTQEPAPKPAAKRPPDIAGFVSAADISTSPQLSKSEIDQVKVLSNQTVQRKLSTFEERIKKRGRI